MAKKLSPEQLEELRLEWCFGTLSLRQLANNFGFSGAPGLKKYAARMGWAGRISAEEARQEVNAIVNTPISEKNNSFGGQSGISEFF
jgi:hypothetical protein